MDNKIDFVLIWVDGGDKEWQKERNRCAGKDPEDLADYRYRDWDNLKYWFRGVEKFAPWVNNVYFITNGQKPDWLNVNHPKLKWIKHEDYIPKEYLPTFNSHTIEHNFFRIKELSNQFVYFNDDMFLINKVNPCDFFVDGKPCIMAGLRPCINPDEMYSHITLNDALLINRNYCFRELFKKNFGKWINLKYRWQDNLKTYVLSKFGEFPGMIIPHVENSLLKDNMKDLWDKEYDILNETCLKKFRDKNQVSQNIYTWSIAVSGNFEIRTNKFGHFYYANELEKVKTAIKEQQYKSICINDSNLNVPFQEAKETINSAFESILPDKSNFEL